MISRRRKNHKVVRFCKEGSRILKAEFYGKVLQEETKVALNAVESPQALLSDITAGRWDSVRCPSWRIYLREPIYFSFRVSAAFAVLSPCSAVGLVSRI